MRELITTSDLSYAESVRIALEAHQIEVEVTGPRMYAPFGGGVGNSMAIFVRHDRDYDRAHALLQDLVQTPVPKVDRADVQQGLHALWKIAIVTVGFAALWYWVVP